MSGVNRRSLLTVTAALLGTVLMSPALADKQAFPERSLSVNVNDATRDELMSLPGIGFELASSIIKMRPYNRIEDLLRIKGIGEYKLGEIRPYVKVKGKTGPYAPD